jgi:hypothetical protein
MNSRISESVNSVARSGVSRRWALGEEYPPGYQRNRLTNLMCEVQDFSDPKGLLD